MPLKQPVYSHRPEYGRMSYNGYESSRICIVFALLVLMMQPAMRKHTRMPNTVLRHHAHRGDKCCGGRLGFSTWSFPVSLCIGGCDWLTAVFVAVTHY